MLAFGACGGWAPSRCRTCTSSIPEARQARPVQVGLRTIDVADIAGTSVGGGDQRGGDFLPLKPFRGKNWSGRWQRLRHGAGAPGRPAADRRREVRRSATGSRTATTAWRSRCTAARSASMPAWSSWCRWAVRAPNRSARSRPRRPTRGRFARPAAVTGRATRCPGTSRRIGLPPDDAPEGGAPRTRSRDSPAHGDLAGSRPVRGPERRADPPARGVGRGRPRPRALGQPRRDRSSRRDRRLRRPRTDLPRLPGRRLRRAGRLRARQPRPWRSLVGDRRQGPAAPVERPSRRGRGAHRRSLRMARACDPTARMRDEWTAWRDVVRASRSLVVRRLLGSSRAGPGRQPRAAAGRRRPCRQPLSPGLRGLPLAARADPTAALAPRSREPGDHRRLARSTTECRSSPTSPVRWSSSWCHRRAPDGRASRMRP